MYNKNKILKRISRRAKTKYYRLERNIRNEAIKQYTKSLTFKNMLELHRKIVAYL